MGYLILKVNDQQVDLKNSDISFSLLSPLFSDDGGIDGSFAFSQNIPATSKNNKIFGFPERIKKNDYSYEKHIENPNEFKCQLFLNGLIFLNGTINVTETNGEYFDIYIKAGQGDFISQARDLFMPDIDYGDEIAFGLSASKALVTKKYPETKIAVFPVKADNYLEGAEGNIIDTAPDPPGYDNIWNDRVRYMNFWATDAYLHLQLPYTGFIGTHYDDSNGDPVYANLFLTPFPYLPHVVNSIFTNFNYIINDNVFELHDELSTLVVFNTTCGVEIELRAGTLGYYDWWVCKNYAIINIANHVPNVLITDFLIGLKNMFGLGYFFNHSNKTVSIKTFKDIIINPDYIEWSHNCFPSYTVSLKDKITGVKLISKFDSADANSNKITEIDENNCILESPVATFSHLSTGAPYDQVATVRLVLDENNYYILKLHYDRSRYWDLFSYNSQPFKVGKPPYMKIETPFSSLMMHNGSNERPYGGQRSWLTPHIDQKGNTVSGLQLNKSTGLYFKGHDFAPRLLFYRGMQNASTADYPLGSCDVYDYSGSKIPDANLALKWDGIYGLYENFWKEWLHWYMNIRKAVKYNKYLTAEDLHQFDFSKKYMIDGVKYLIKQIDFNLSDINNENFLAEVELYKC